MRVLSTIVLVTLLGASVVLYSQTQDDLWTQCTSNNVDTNIAGCTALIQSGQLKGSELALAFSNRGFGYFQKAEYDQALQDYNQALQIDPRLELAYENRATVYLQMGQYDQSIQDVRALS